jgi:thiol-disulfide isomerase/thioredoxin
MSALTRAVGRIFAPEPEPDRRRKVIGLMKKQSRGRRRLLILAAELLLFAVVYLAVRSWLQQDMADGLAPPIEAALVDGSSIDLQQYQGKPVLVYFWASWCTICKLEQGAINAIKKDWPVITIAMQSGNARDIDQYLKENGLDWPVIADPDGRLAQRYGVRGVPSSFILDKDGVIHFRESGYTTSYGLRLRLWAARSGFL